MILNEAGKIAKEEWEKTAEIRKNISLGAFIIMPNHFHAIISIDYQIKNATGELPFAPNKKGDIENKDSGDSATGDIATGDIATGVLQYAPEFKSPSNTIGAIIRGYKGATTKKIKELFYKEERDLEDIAPIPLKGSIWQRNYYEHIIRNENAYNRITQYIINNPKNWKKDKFKNKK